MHYVSEREDAFLALFPHRFDYIYAPHPEPGEKPSWRTETRYPLSDRLIQQGAYLYGVRFGKQTRYCLIDIDINSPYHPNHDPLAISRLTAALEPLGLTSYIVGRSSQSGGLHLYFPFQSPQSSWKLAAAVSALLTNHGFKLRTGQLEVFPNPKPYVVGGHPTHFNAHRLPLQPGFWLLNSELEPAWSDRLTFMQHWRFAEAKNDLTELVLERILKQVKRQTYRVSNQAEKFLNDLNAEIELGWTAHGQTNRLLGRIALRTYVFHHVIANEAPLTGQALVDQVIQIAQSLPGYSEWCRHQHEITDRVQEWVRCVENSHYFPYGLKKATLSMSENTTDDQSNALTWNQKQSNTTREKIKAAVRSLLEANLLPRGITDRFQALVSFGISGSSLYRHRDLWHPEDLEDLKNLKEDLEVGLESEPEPEIKFEFKSDLQPDLKLDPISDPGTNPITDSRIDPKLDLTTDPTSDFRDQRVDLRMDSRIDLERGNNSSRDLTYGHPQLVDPPTSLNSLICCTSLLPATGCNVLSDVNFPFPADDRSRLSGCNAFTDLDFRSRKRSEVLRFKAIDGEMKDEVKMSSSFPLRSFYVRVKDENTGTLPKLDRREM